MNVPQGATRRFAAAAFFALAALPAAAEVIAPGEGMPRLPRVFVGTLQGPANALFPGSRAGTYGFLQAEGALTYFRINGLETRARRIEADGRIFGSYTDRLGRTREFAIPMPRQCGYVDVRLDADHDEDDVVG